ncbi:MAG: helix-turn-helix domain-containing protein [Bacteroidota bacterium]
MDNSPQNENLIVSLHGKVDRLNADVRLLIEQNLKDYYSPREVGEKTGFTKRMILNYCNDGTIKAEKVGNSWRIPRAEYLSFTESKSSTQMNSSDG